MSPSKEELWRACAGRTVSVSEPNSDVFYYPQGHAENANCSAAKAVELGLLPLVHCRVLAAELKAEDDTDELYERILLLPIVPGSGEVLGRNQTAPLVPGSDEEAEVEDGEEASSAKTASYAKVLTQSDANNGGGFSVPRHCADTVFPALDYAADPPMQDLAAYDVHGKVWNFRHIYRGTPRRHLITSGWSAFVNRKGLVAGDSLLFHRISNGDISVGIRRAPRRSNSAFGARAEEFAKAVKAAASGEEFEVRFYPREKAAEFCVKASRLRAGRAAVEGQCWPGMKVKMDVENEVASGVKSCAGTVVSAKVVDPVHWPNSPWRMLKVDWDDESDRLRISQCVCPWMIKPVDNQITFPSVPFPPTSRKKRRLALLAQLCVPFSIPRRVFANDAPESIQGARHTTNVVQPNEKSTVADELGTGNLPPSSEKSEKKTILFSLRGESIVVEKQGGSAGSKCDDIEKSTEREKSVGSRTIVQPAESARAAAPHNLYSFLFDELNIGKSAVMCRVMCRDPYINGPGTSKPTATEPFGVLVKSAKRMTISALPDTSEVGPSPGSSESES